MVTPLGNTFSTDKQVVAQGDVTYMGKVIESLVMEFDQAKYEEFISSGSKSPRARQYRKVSSGTYSWVPSEIPSDATGAKSAMANHITCKARVNVSHETCEVSVVDVQPAHTRPLSQLQVTGGSQQLVRRNRNAERRQRRRARQLQTQEAGTTICPAICPTDTEREAQARVSSEPRLTREVHFCRPKREAHKTCASEALLPKHDVQ